MVLALTSRHSGDAISAALQRLALRRADLDVLDVADLDPAVDFNDDGCATLALSPDAEQRLNNAGAIVNRAFLSAAALQSSEHTVLLLQTEVEDRLRALLNQCPAATARAGLYGLCGDYLPLFLQWHRVAALGLPVSVPRYDYAFGSLPPQVDDFAAPIYTNAFDLRRWKPNAPPASFWHSFAIDRPPGTPLVAVVVGERVLVNAALPADVLATVERVSRAAAEAFGSRFGELLYFVDGTALCFAAFSHVVRQPLDVAALDDAVEAVLRRGLH